MDAAIVVLKGQLEETALFDGATYDPALDCERLKTQFRDVFSLMADGTWRSLDDIEIALGFPQASISARLRDMRKRKFGAHTVNRRRVKRGGTHEYQLLPNAGGSP